MTKLIPQDDPGRATENELGALEPGRLARFKRPLIALALTLIVPGLGQLYNRQLAKGILFAAAAPILLFAGTSLGLLHRFSTFVVCLLLAITLNLCILIDALRGAWKQRPDRAAGSRRWGGYSLFAVIAIFNLYAGLSDFYRDRIVGVRAFRTPAGSMAPTLQTGDRFIANMRAYRARSPERTEIIVFETLEEQTRLVKRVIAVGNDTLEIDERGVWVNGKKLDEPYLATIDPKLTRFGPKKIPAGEFFVMGDDRMNSYDSRHYGPVKRAQIKGRPLFICWSPDTSRIGKEIR